MVTTLALPAGVVGRAMRHHMTMVQTVDTTPAAVDVALPLCCSIAHKHRATMQWVIGILAQWTVY